MRPTRLSSWFGRLVVIDEPRGTLIVTGASRGIGAAVAALAARDGWAVAVNYRADQARADALVTEIVGWGGRALAIQADVAREAEIMRLFEIADHSLGPVQGLVNNAGVTGGKSRVENLTSEIIGKVMDVNVAGAMLCAREAVRCMSTHRGGQGGGIVNLSSIASRIGSAGEWVHYAASKGAIDSFTIGLAREVAGEGIRVNAVAPGLIETDLHAENGDPDRPRRMASAIPMQRSGQPDEIAEAVVWLLSPAASYVTGAILEVGGGR
jgi:NAD(P)-dependent dehydrogenase (short-subunit alcohol dehydrogenase family)